MERREFIKYGAAGLATAGVGLSPIGAMAQTCAPCTLGAVSTSAVKFDLSIKDVVTKLIDGKRVNMLGYGLDSGSGTSNGRVPGPVLRVKEGTAVQIKITNTRREPHSFEITGILGTKATIAPLCFCTINFTAPTAGTYLYHDAYNNSPLYRILGLHGVLIVEPLYGKTAGGSVTPYSFDKLGAAEKASIGALFDALGMTPRFKGGLEGKWVPAPTNKEFSHQEKIWLLSQVDPKFNALLVPGQPFPTTSPLTQNVVDNFLPRYFTINGRSGFDLADSEDVVASNYVGEPTLIRTVNAGLCHHSNHVHGNHVIELSEAQIDPAQPNLHKVVVRNNLAERDVWSMWPMQRKDVLLPFEIPPDIPFAIPVSKPPAEQFDQFTRMVNKQTQEPFPLRYVMHCHCEMSQTAGGGNYPQGMVTHFEILGGVGGRKLAVT